MNYTENPKPNTAAVEVKEPALSYYTAGVGNAIAEPWDDYDEDGEGDGKPLTPEEKAAIRRDPEFIAWEQEIIRSLIESAEKDDEASDLSIDDAFDEIIQGIDNEKIFQELEKAEARRLTGAKTYSIAEVSEHLQEIINGKK